MLAEKSASKNCAPGQLLLAIFKLEYENFIDFDGGFRILENFDFNAAGDYIGNTMKGILATCYYFGNGTEKNIPLALELLDELGYDRLTFAEKRSKRIQRYENTISENLSALVQEKNIELSIFHQKLLAGLVYLRSKAVQEIYLKPPLTITNDTTDEELVTYLQKLINLKTTQPTLENEKESKKLSKTYKKLITKECITINDIISYFLEEIHKECENAIHLSKPDGTFIDSGLLFNNEPLDFATLNAIFVNQWVYCFCRKDKKNSLTNIANCLHYLTDYNFEINLLEKFFSIKIKSSNKEYKKHPVIDWYKGHKAILEIPESLQPIIGEYIKQVLPFLMRQEIYNMLLHAINNNDQWIIDIIINYKSDIHGNLLDWAKNNNNEKAIEIITNFMPQD